MGLSISNQLLGSTGLSVGLGLSRGNGLYFGGFGGAFTPADLFLNGEQGVWYDPSDFSTLFQDSAGTTPVTAVEQPVGLMLDLSKGLAIGSDLLAPLDFSTFATSGGPVTIDSATAYTVAATANVYKAVLTVGKWYRVTINATFTSSALTLYNATNALNTIGSGLTSGVTATYYFNAVATQFNLRPTNAGTVTVNNLALVEISGNHASQSTSASRPVLSARVNQLLATATLSTQSVTTLAATYTLSFSGAGMVTATGTNIGVYTAGSNSLVCTAGTLTLTVVGSVTFADLRVTNDGVGLPAYQRVTTSTDYAVTGFPYYLQFDGTDDSMATGTITPGIDKAQVFAGARKLSDLNSNIVELSASIPSNNGAIRLSTATQYALASKGTVQAVAQTTGSNSAPNTKVITGIGDIAAAIAIIQSDGVVRITTTTDQGTGNYLAYPLFIGSRNGASNFLNGRIYSLIVRFGANLDETTIANTEQWISNEMGGGYYPTGFDFLVDANGDQITDASGNPLYTQPLYL